MSLVNVVLTVLLVLCGVPSAVWGVIKLKSWYEKTREEERFFLRCIVQALQELITKVCQFKCLQAAVMPMPNRASYDANLFLNEQAENAKVGETIRRKLRELKKLKHRYTRWLDEAEYIADSILNGEIEHGERLKAYWGYLLKQGLVWEWGLANDIKEIAYSKLFEGTLNLEYVKQGFLEKYGPNFAVPFALPGTQAYPSAPAPEIQKLWEIHKEPQIKLREHILDSRDFHRLIEELIKVGNRPTVEELRIIQKELLSQLKMALSMVLKRDKTLINEFRELWNDLECLNCLR